MLSSHAVPNPIHEGCIQLVGTGSFTPPQVISNEAFFEKYQPRKADGAPIPPEWVERYFGIHERRLDLDPRTMEKRPVGSGGLTDGDYAVAAGQEALRRARLEPHQVDVLIHVTITPDYVHGAEHLRPITRGLGLGTDTHLIPYNLGCAGLAPALRSARSELLALGPGSVALVIASQCASYLFFEERYQLFRKHRDPWAWLTPVVFGDGAGAMVLVHSSREERHGLLDVTYETDPEKNAVSHPGGGGVVPTRTDTVGEHQFLMNAPLVGRSYVAAIRASLERLERRWPDHVEPRTGEPFARASVKRWYLHQANLRKIEEAITELGLDKSQVPTNVQRLGNTSSASTLMLLDEELRSGALGPGDLVMFLWVGAGNGLQWGGASLRL